MKISLQQIESFYWVARLGGFHAAARHQHLTQPSITARIHELEEILGSKLFERGGYRAEITPLGRDVLAQAEKILRLTDDFEKMGRQRNLMRGFLRLGTNESTASTGLIQLLSRLKAAYPELHVELTIDVGTALSRKLNARELDITMLMDPISAPHAIDEVIGQTELQWVASTNLNLPKRELVPSDIASFPIVVTPPPSALHTIMLEWFRKDGIELANLSTCNSVALMTQLVSAGHAIALLPFPMVHAEINNGIIRALPVKPAVKPRPYYVSYLREGTGYSAFVEMAREVLTQSGLVTPLKF
jgi:DNA-binding transcriptional LysR family regulator